MPVHRSLFVAIATIVGLVAGCSGTSAPAASAPSSPFPSASASPAAADPPSTEPSSPVASSGESSPSHAPPSVRSDSFVYVVTDDLRVRSKPAVSDDSVKYSPLLWRGQLAWVFEGPVRGSGYDWYRIDPFGEFDPDVSMHPDPPPDGWVAAASKDGDPWIEDANIPVSADASQRTCPRSARTRVYSV